VDLRREIAVEPREPLGHPGLAERNERAHECRDHASRHPIHACVM